MIPSVTAGWWRLLAGELPERRDVVSMRLALMSKSNAVTRAPFDKMFEELFYRILVRTGDQVSEEYRRSHHVPDLLIEDQLLAPFRELYRKLYTTVEREFGRRALSSIHKKDAWTEWEPTSSRELVEWNRTRLAQNISDVGKLTRAKISKVIADGVARGKTVDEIAATLRSQFAFSQQRARKIAQTEITAASNAGSRFAVATNVSQPDSLIKVWLAEFDSRTRASHASASGQRRSFNTPYRVGSSQLMFPGDGSLGASARELVNCRCTEFYLR